MTAKKQIVVNVEAYYREDIDVLFNDIDTVMNSTGIYRDNPNYKWLQMKSNSPLGLIDPYSQTPPTWHSHNKKHDNQP